MSLLDLLKEKKQALAAGRRGRTVKPPMNRSMWRILPSWKGDGQQFWQDFGQHFIKDASGQILAIYVDTEKTFGRPSELNALIGQAIKSCTDDATMQLLKDAKSSGSVLLNAMQTDSPNPTKVEILEIRPSVFEQIITLAQEYEEAGESIFDVNAGREIIILREGTGLNTKYTVQAAVKNRVAVVPPDVMKQLNDLEAYVAQESAEGAFRALNAVKSIAGLLPAAGSGPAGLGASGIPTAGRLPSPAAAAAMIEEDPYAAAPAPGKGATPSVEFEDVPELAPTPTPVAAAPAPAATAPAAAAAVVESTGDPELDKLLAGL